MNWWNHIPEHINPNILEIGSFQVRYYGLMYVAAFTTIYLLVLGRLKNEGYEYSKGDIQKYFTMGQILSIAMILDGTFIMLIKRNKN